MTDLRRDLQREASVLDGQMLKDTRWLLTESPENLNPDRTEAERLPKLSSSTVHWPPPF